MLGKEPKGGIVGNHSEALEALHVSYSCSDQCANQISDVQSVIFHITAILLTIPMYQLCVHEYIDSHE